jgi:hypothetical protein
MKPIAGYIGFNREPRGSPVASGVWGLRDTPVIQIPFLSDTFAGSAGVLLSSVSHSPRWGDYVVEDLPSSLARSGSSSAVRGTNDAYNNSGSVLHTGRTNFYAQCVVGAVGSFAVLARTTAYDEYPGNYHIGYGLHVTATNNASLYRNAQYSSTTLTSTSIPTMRVGDTFGIRVNGSTITGFYNNAQILSVVNSDFSHGTYTGLLLGPAPASASRFDVFAV